MKKKCNYCESYYDDALESCPQCGAPNDNIRKSIGVPQTIEELKQWYVQHNLPPKEVTRFFIGENYKGPKAFGIYKDEESGQFIVYKNKSDGSRAIRYDGKDESYAVNELYVKLKEQIAEEKAKNNKPPSYSYKKKHSFLRRFVEIGVIALVLLVAILTYFSVVDRGPSNGVYTYQDQEYYYDNGYWYIWDTDTDDWSSSDVPDELEDHYRRYYEDNDDSSDSYWDDDDDDDWDSDSSWDSGSDWGGSSDWDSDW